MTGISASRTVVVVTAGLGQPSATSLLGARLGDAVRAALAGRGEAVRVETVDLRPLAHQLVDHLLTGFAGEALAEAQALVARAHAVVVVTPVFSASFSGLFKTFFDVLDRGALRGVPVLLAATGGSARHSLVIEHALRPLFAHLGALTVPTGVFAATEDWGGHGAEALADRMSRAAGELADVVAGLPQPTQQHQPEPALDFEQLLRAVSG